MTLSLRSKITRGVLAELFLRPTRSFYINELSRRLSLDSGNLTRKLQELEKTGVLQSELRGKERYYSVNPEYSLLAEYKRIILKTVGAEALVRNLVRGLPGIRHAYIFGSYAIDRMNEASDIDLLVVGDHKTIELQKKLTVVQKKISRTVNLISLSEEEYGRRKKTDAFLKSIEAKPRVVLA